MAIAMDAAVDTSLVKHSLVLLPAKAGHIMTYNTCPPTTL